jgi:transcriptional regulator with XRE-family HTH domain
VRLTVENWQAVADAINARMAELNVSQRELAERSGVSPATLREIQHASANRRRSSRTLAAVSRALQWPDEHLAAVLGARHTPGVNLAQADEGDVMDRLDAIHREVGRLADAVERLVQQGGGTA